MASLKEDLRAHGGTIAEKPLIRPDMIDVEPGFNVRVPRPEIEAHIEWLMGQIKLKGFDQTQPITVTRNGERFTLRDGHNRMAAVWRLIEQGEPILTVPALLEAAKTNDVERGYSLGTKAGALPLCDLDYGVLVKRLRGYGQTDEQILAGFGKNRAWLARIMDLAGAPMDVQGMVARNEVGSTAAVDLVRKNGAEAGTIIRAALAVAKTERRTKARPRDIEAVRPRTDPVSVATLACRAVKAWRASQARGARTDALDEAMETLEARLGVALLEAA